MIASHADLLDAYAAGRHWCTRFIKTGAGQVQDTNWQDWAYQAGQPSYDARIGEVAAFTPVVAVGNDAIYIPPIAAGLQRVLHKITMLPKASQASQASIDFVLYDLVGYYPLIDGDSTDTQEMDNTQTLPRYADGAGLRLVMVNHVSPATASGRMLLEYTDENDADQTLDTNVPLLGINCACSGTRTTPSADVGPLCLPIGQGVKRVNRITYSTPPGGLQCIYVIKPLAQFTHYHDALLQADTSGIKSAIEIDFTKDGFRLPIIKDGAHLSFFYRNNGGSRSTTFFGDAEFAWG